MKRVLVVGAKPGSLGDAVAAMAMEDGFDVVTAGIADEDVELDVTSNTQLLRKKLGELNPSHIVVTAGINEPAKKGDGSPYVWYHDHFDINCIGPMLLLDAWGETKRDVPNHYVVISSNSAHIARTGSAAYCASKAALSMAVRCVARDYGRRRATTLVYGYEPGLLADTPMTQEVIRRLGGAYGTDPGQLALHRMPGVMPDGIPPVKLARLIVHNLRHGGRELNGVMLRLDAGEQ